MAMPDVYVVESVGFNRVIRVHRRSSDYDTVADRFRNLRKFQCRELRMVKMVNGARILLKFLTKSRMDSNKPR